ncbi:hypothetical protein A8M77_24190 [Variovorax sp. JS1663]|nr:hypothetical protein A8M77_24190 [Variovorax sp. JS1663]
MRYKLYLPPTQALANARAARPMVVMLHGAMQGAADFAAGTGMNALARELGIVVLYPEQSQHANAQRCWNWFDPGHQARGHGEPAVLAALTRSIATEHHVDPERVYVAGLSAGGAMADIVGNCYPDVFAGVGVHSGLPTGAATDFMTALSAMRSGSVVAAGGSTVRASRPPTIVFHGDADPTVHASNGKALVDAVLCANRAATGTAPTARIVEGCSNEGQRYTRTIYSDVGGRCMAEHWLLRGARHAWSGGSPRGSYTNPAGVDASTEMLRFFLAQPRREGEDNGATT